MSGSNFMFLYHLKGLLMRILPSMLSLLLAAVVGTAIAAEAVQEAQFTTKDGTVLTVVSNDDGTITVLNSDGTVVTGAAAAQVLATAGISLKVNPQGKSVAVHVAPSVKVTEKPQAVSATTVAAVQSAAPVAAPAGKTDSAQAKGDAPKADAPAAPAPAPAASAPSFAAPVLPPNVPSSSGSASQSFNANTGSTVTTNPGSITAK